MILYNTMKIMQCKCNAMYCNAMQCNAMQLPIEYNII